MSDELVPAVSERSLTAARFQRLAEVSSELEWFANIDNKSARRAYENAPQDTEALRQRREPVDGAPEGLRRWVDELPHAVAFVTRG